MDDLVGMVFGRWTVLSFSGLNKHRQSLWECRCDCGTLRVVIGNSLKMGKTRSCSCSQQEIDRRTHGLTGTLEYRIWASMLQRCENPNVKGYTSYGERGITVCDRWHKFENFIADMGLRTDPSLTLERTDNDKGYSPENCRWATRIEQARNMRSTKFIQYRGKRMTVREALEISGSGASIKLASKRIFERNWDITRAIETPPDKLK